MIYLRGEPVYMAIPYDLVDRMLDFVIHSLAALSRLFKKPGKDHNLFYCFCGGKIGLKYL
jgi:hypothetical protein